MKLDIFKKEFYIIGYIDTSCLGDDLDNFTMIIDKR